MEKSEIGASTSNESGGPYHVFLSFRGTDTRYGFTNNLYHALIDVGIHVFIDYEELRLGENISSTLLQAINESRLYIPIFSRKYASSHWCLRELAMMVENKSKEDKKKFILPIFYDVIPDDVELKTTLYRDDILELEQKKKYDSKDVETWRQALIKVCQDKGLQRQEGDGDLIQFVVREVLFKLEIRQKQVPKNLVGTEDYIAAIGNLLGCDSSGVRVIVIYGMGGIGKTTLAKIIFNKFCPDFGKNCSFLDDVREAAKAKDGLVELQKKLLSDICGPTVAESIRSTDGGINMIGQTICNKKVLIVLDDVDEHKQIQCLFGVNSLCAGTVVLVTTRDKSILNISGFKYEFKAYEMVPLRGEDALELFCRHAFGENSPQADYDTLSTKIVHTAKGLPLALEVIGSSLFGIEKKEIWNERLEKLKKIPDGKVSAKLRISYDALEQNHQEIFLDVACFFVGEDKTNPMYMWGDCKLEPETTIDVLTKRCMLKILDDGTFEMHDHLRDLGRAIAQKERTRLWDEEDIIRELRKTKDEERVKALRWESWDSNVITSEQIKRFPEIRFLSLYSKKCQGDFMGCLAELRWISLHYDNTCDQSSGIRHLEATNLLHLENAIVVDLRRLQFPDDVFESLIKAARRLKVLAISSNYLIRETPTFPKYSHLEKLTFVYSTLSKIDCSIGNLSLLTELTIQECCRLRKLPKQIGMLRKLQHLSLKWCSGLTKLPDTLSKLESLTTLDVSWTEITRLPHSIGRLSRLSFLDVSGTPIVEMPRGMGKLRQLQTLKMECCDKIQELPKLPRSLTILWLSSNALLSVPNLSYLTNLDELHLSNYGDRLERTNPIQTSELSWIGRLSKLSKLAFHFPTLYAPNTELSSLALLKELLLCGLELPPFEQLPSNLTFLDLSDRVPLLEKETDTRGKQVHIDGGCKELQASELTDHLRGPFLFPSSQKHLQELHLSWFPDVQDIQFVSAFESLEEFSVTYCSSLKSLGGLSNLKNLKRLDIKSCESLRVIEGFDKLEFLHELHISRCRSAEVIFDTSSSKIPINCSIYINLSGEYNPRNCYYNSEDYRKKIPYGTKQASVTEMETTDSESEEGEPLQKTNQESKGKKRKRKTESAKQQGRRKRRKLQKSAWVRLFHRMIFFCRARKMKRRKERARQSAKEREKRKRGRRA